MLKYQKKSKIGLDICWHENNIRGSNFLKRKTNLKLHKKLIQKLFSPRAGFSGCFLEAKLLK